MKQDGLFRSIIRAVVQEEKKQYINKPMDLLIDAKKHRWYRIMDFIDTLEEESQEKGSDSDSPKA